MITLSPPHARFHDIDRDAARRRLERLADFLDSRARVPGTRIRFGADAVLNLIPGLGTAVATAISAYLIVEAHRLGAPKQAMARMIGNVAIDGLLGAIPLVGWVGDLLFRANNRNVAILNRHLEQERIR